MKNEFKTILGNWVIKLGEHSVGKCMIPGMYDPKIPQELKDDMQLEESVKNSFAHGRNT